MPSVNSISLRDKFNVYKTDIVSLQEEGKISKEAGKVIKRLCLLLEIIIAIFFEKTTKKTSKNSSIPPSQTGKDENGKISKKKRSMDAEQDLEASENFRTVTIEETSTVETCGSCGIDFSDIEPSDHEERVQVDIKFTVEKKKVTAEIKECPECRVRTKGRFPENMPGPLQYGDGVKAFVTNLLAPTCCPCVGVLNWCKPSRASNCPRPHVLAIFNGFMMHLNHGKPVPKNTC